MSTAALAPEPDTTPPPRRGRNGGLPARVALVRWSWRLLRREWRQQVLLVALVAFTAAGAALGLCAGHAYPKSPNGSFGSARQKLTFEVSEAARLQARLDTASTALGPIEAIGHRDATIPGSIRPLDIRAQDPHGRYGAAMLRLVSGRYPAGGAEIALTRSAADVLSTAVGATVTLDGQTLDVVGLVENPQNLADRFALAAPETAADAAGSTSGGTSVGVVAGRPAATVDVLVRASDTALSQYRVAETEHVALTTRAGFDTGAASAAVFALAAVALLLVSLVAAAGFAVIAHRRLRQTGMLAALGATPRQLRLVLVAHGTLTGVIAAAIGTLLGVLAWLPLAPGLEQGAGHRIDALDLPWSSLALMGLVAVLAPTAAAWWPARTAAAVPAAQAISARPPQPVPARQSAWAAALLLACGFGALVASDRSDGRLVVAGIVAVVLGLLFLSPLAVRMLAATAGRMPFTPRLALRDLGRHQARSGAALAAITLAVGVPVAVSVLAAANQDSATRGNLSAAQLLVRIGGNEPVLPLLGAGDVARLDAAVRRYADALGATTTPLVQVVTSEGVASRSSEPGRPLIEIGKKVGSNKWTSLPLYVGTPEVARTFGFDLTAGAPDADLLTSLDGPLEILGTAERDLIARSHRIPGSSYTSVPKTFLTPAALERHGWQQAAAGWFVQAPDNLTDAQITAARGMAAGYGLTVEVRDNQDDLATVRWAAVISGVVLALGVLAMTVGTIRAEATDDLRTLTATGATRRIRRDLTAATAGGLAVAGVLLGTAGAYLVLTGAYFDDLGTLRHVPYGPLTLALLGIPVLATATGWLIAGREPTTTTRRLLD